MHIFLPVQFTTNMVHFAGVKDSTIKNAGIKLLIILANFPFRKISNSINNAYR